MKTIRNIVLHQTYDNIQQMLDVIQQYDVLFFDDCLYSQYLFIKAHNEEFKKKNVTCIIGFSTQIYRRPEQQPIERAYCAEYHDRVHANDYNAYAAYMSLFEIKELLEYDNVKLAGHGANHLQLELLKVSPIEKYKLFSNDIHQMLKDLEDYNLKTDVFVYPYAYDDFILSKKLLIDNGFIHIYAGKNTLRLPIENIINNVFELE